MRSVGRRVVVVLIFVLCASVVVGQDILSGVDERGGVTTPWLRNMFLTCSVSFGEGKLLGDSLEADPAWLAEYGSRQVAVATDADFALDLMWTGWRAPGKAGNAENPVLLKKDDFVLERHEITDLPGGGKAVNLYFKGSGNTLELLLTYSLGKDDFFARRRLAVRDPKARNHFLRRLWARHGRILTEAAIIKPGGFGLPAAASLGDGGAFFGAECPAAENSLECAGDGTVLKAGQEIGERIGEDRIESSWVVSGLSPNAHVKLWFGKYVDGIRVAPLRPYLLYNSWYDLRAPEMVDRPEHVLNEENLLRIIGLFRSEMFEKHGLRLDAFVLDDGWDVYRSDWVLRPEQFPHGLKPVAGALAEMSTSLGIWFGPIGGYSHRDWRIGWMGEHGYELVGDQLCIAGTKYHELFKKRVVDLVADEGVGYFKWDGIQFSCSQPDHGHPVGLYSRRAVMNAVIDLCDAVRSANPKVFLNITSGTWLSPWWLQHANQVWMQGYDYGYADVPSISRRDAAITYRDFVLYDDLRRQGLWFPIANLMTHGIIKGHLQMLGGEAEPPDKFTDNALLYFARGVTMYELYISPDLLTEGEWQAVGKSILWAKDRFDVLRSTEMVGGDPGAREAYGYAHFAGERGVIAARNPFIEPRTLTVELSPAAGLDPRAASLVVERVYPSRRVSPRLYAAGATIEIPLRGYETAVYEIYPLGQAGEPLLADVTFEVEKAEGRTYALRVYDAGENVRLLNPELVDSVAVEGEQVSPRDFSSLRSPSGAFLKAGELVAGAAGDAGKLSVDVEVGPDAARASLAVLLEPAEKTDGENDPVVTVAIDGAEARLSAEKQKGVWGWYLAPVEPGRHACDIEIAMPEQGASWAGRVSIWLVADRRLPGTSVAFELERGLESPRPMPPLPLGRGEFRSGLKIGTVTIAPTSAEQAEGDSQ